MKHSTVNRQNQNENCWWLRLTLAVRLTDVLSDDENKRGASSRPFCPCSIIGHRLLRKRPDLHGIQRPTTSFRRLGHPAVALRLGK